MRKHHVRSVVAVCLVVSFLGCSLLPGHRTATMTLEDIVQLSQEKVAPQAIIAKLKESKMVYPLKADQVVELKEQGVDSEVLDYMLVAFVESERRKTRWKYVTVVAIGMGITCLLCHAERGCCPNSSTVNFW